jgi:hypothetical protein
MRKEFVVKRIDTSPDGSTFVIISLTSAKDFLEGTKTQSRFDPSKMMNPANMEDVMKDLNKMLSGSGGMLGGETSLKLDMHEYKEMNLSIGDRVYLELTAENDSGI